MNENERNQLVLKLLDIADTEEFASEHPKEADAARAACRKRHGIPDGASLFKLLRELAIKLGMTVPPTTTAPTA